MGKDDGFTVKQSTITVLDRQIRKLSAKIETITSRISELEELISNQFASMRKVGYRIHSIFVHRGQATFGHYWVYINDFQTGTFRKYNDEYITEVPREEVFDESDESTATPYFLVFVRDDLANDFVNSVVRERPSPSPSVTPVISAVSDADQGTGDSGAPPSDMLISIDDSREASESEGPKSDMLVDSQN